MLLKWPLLWWLGAPLDPSGAPQSADPSGASFCVRVTGHESEHVEPSRALRDGRAWLAGYSLFVPPLYSAPGHFGFASDICWQDAGLTSDIFRQIWSHMLDEGRQPQLRWCSGASLR